MLSAKVLIVAVILTCCAVSIHSVCQVKSETCDDKDMPKVRICVGKLVECDEKYEDKESKDMKDCRTKALMKLLGTDAATAILTHDCGKFQTMEECDNKRCCETTFKYLLDCCNKALLEKDPNFTPLTMDNLGR